MVCGEPNARDLGTVTHMRKRHMAWNPATEINQRSRPISDRM